MADVLELPPLDVARPRGQVGRRPLQGLDAGQLVGAHGALPAGRPLGRGAVDGAHVGDLLVPLLIGRRA